MTTRPAPKSFFDSGPGGIDLGPTLVVGTMLIGVASVLYLYSRYRRATVPDQPIEPASPPAVPES